MSKSSINNESPIDNPAYVRCTMLAFEEGARASAIKQRCQCEAQSGSLDHYLQPDTLA